MSGNEPGLSAKHWLLNPILSATSTAVTVSEARADQPLVWVNPAFTATTGYRLEDVIGRNCRFLQGEDTEAGDVATLRAAVQTGRGATVVLLNYRQDGSPFWNQVAVSPIRDGAGTLTHFVGVQTDVTEAERARLRVQVLGRRLSIVAEATGLLAATFNVEQAMDRLVRLVVPLLADWVVIDLTDDGGLPGGQTFVWHRDGRQDLLDRYRELAWQRVATGAAPYALPAAGPPELLADYTASPGSGLGERERQLRRINLELGATSVVFAPLTARRTVIGTMMLVQGPSGRRFSDDDLDVAVDLGLRTGLAVDNARLFTREQSTALALQRSLLPVLPDVPGLTLAAEYLPAGQDSQIGGDWWDVFALPDGATGLAVGDVMGHDLAAAAAMGQLRSVLRTCAWDGDGPAAVLDRMDQLVQGFDMAQLATCFYARLEPPDNAGGRRRLPRLFWSNAGHLPPVLLGPDGHASLLHGGAGVPIGVPYPQAREAGNLTLPPGSTLLLYTDGLVETRDGDIDTDLQRLLDQVAAHRPQQGPQALIDRLVQGLTDRPDDVALLAVRLE